VVEGGAGPLPEKIAMLAPPWILIPPPRYGGIETVIADAADKQLISRNLPENYRLGRRGTGCRQFDDSRKMLRSKCSGLCEPNRRALRCPDLRRWRRPLS
jgi:hypothetical protein